MNLDLDPLPSILHGRCGATCVNIANTPPTLLLRFIEVMEEAICFKAISIFSLRSLAKLC